MPASSVSVTFPSYGSREELPRGVRVIREEYRHDIAVYETTLPRRNFAHKSGTPVSIKWAHNRNSSEFFGYVNHIEPIGDNRVTVWCRSASSSLDNGAQAIFRDRTVSSIVGEVARSLNFDAAVVEHGQVFDSITATGGRLWRTLVENAEEIGHSFYATNTRLMLHPRLATVRKYAGEAPVLLSEPGGEFHSLFEFSPVDGHATPGRSRPNRIINGIDPRTGAKFSVKGGVMRSELGRTMTLPTGTVYENLGRATPMEARWKLAAIAENERFNISAGALAAGDPRVTQTWPVIVAGTGSLYEGLWFVNKVVHNITDPIYTMDLQLSKDGQGSTVDIPDVRARRVIATRNNPQGRPKSVFPASVLVGGQWRSQWSASSRTFVEKSARVR